MSASRVAEPIVIAIDIDDTELSERLFASLSEAPGLRIAQHGEPADVTVVAATGSTPASDNNEATLTPRELEVLGLMAEGASNKAIAHRLGISVHTAKFHVGSLLDKLDATGRTDAVAQAVRQGVIHL